jgi:hypothetical protein
MNKFLSIVFLILKMSNSYAQNASLIYKNNVNSTITIETDNGSIGSGFFIAPFIIATNYHVVEGANSASCYLNNSNEKYEIEGFVGIDKVTDLILLKVSQLNKPSIKISRTKVVVGQKLFVMGSPKGLSSTISEGIVSGLRNINGSNLIQMTAPISPGSSGGPVFNSVGELIGISVQQIKDGQNLNFAIPSNYLQILIDFKKETPSSFDELVEKEVNKTNNKQTEFEAMDFIKFYSNEWGCEKHAEGTFKVRLEYQMQKGKLTVKEYLPSSNAVEYVKIDLDLSKIKSVQFEEGSGECSPLIVSFYENGFGNFRFKLRNSSAETALSPLGDFKYGTENQWKWESVRLAKVESQKERAKRLTKVFEFLAEK